MFFLPRAYDKETADTHGNGIELVIFGILVGETRGELGHLLGSRIKLNNLSQ